MKFKVALRGTYRYLFFIMQRFFLVGMKKYLDARAFQELRFDVCLLWIPRRYKIPRSESSSTFFSSIFLFF